MRGGGDALCWLPNLPFGCTVQNELGLSNPGPIGGRRLSEAVSLNLGADYVSELGSGGAWADQRLTKSEIAADPEAAALATYFRQVRTMSVCFDVAVALVHTWHSHMLGHGLHNCGPPLCPPPCLPAYARS